jgi:uncharacterized protein YndB with AHSA1/START domain
MTRTWYPLEPADETFFSTAPFRHTYPVELPVPPERLWASLTSDEGMAAWGLGVGLQWTSPRPFGVGTTRTVVLPLHAMTVHEHFFRWDDGRRKSFYVEEANHRMLKRFAEDYLVEATPGGSRFTWTIALEPLPSTALLVRASDPVNRLACRAVPMRAKAYFAKHG